MPAQAANALALLVTAVGNTAANRRFTFAIHGRRHNVRHQLQGLGVFGLALGLTSGSLALLHALDPDPSRAVELIVLTCANVLATILRFVLPAPGCSGPAALPPSRLLEHARRRPHAPRALGA